MNLFLLRGLPGSGKSTVGSILGNGITFSADDFFTDSDGKYNFDVTKLGAAHQQCQNKVEDVLKDLGHLSGNIFVCNTFTTEREMKPYFDLAEKYNVPIFTLIVENRHGSNNVHDVPEERIEIMKNRFNIQL